MSAQYTLSRSFGNTSGSNEALTAGNAAQTLEAFDYDLGYNAFDVRHTFNLTRPLVLIVEDEPDIAALIKHTLERSGTATATIAASGDAALDAVAARCPNVIVLDLNLPSMDGLEVCRILRARPDSIRVPIIMLTARTSEDDRVLGLRQGADDYVTKPFSLRELCARVEASLRRTAGEHTLATYRGQRLVVDFDAVAITVDNVPVRLTRREFDLLRYLVQNKNRVVSRDRLLETVWGYEKEVETRSVDVHVGRLRVKLHTAGHQIETVIGMGYRFVD
jgi:DNA-binding response OmpR family regulator